MKQMHWNYGILVVALVGSILASSCAQTAPPAPTPTPTPTPTPPTATAWMDIELTDVATGQRFKISDFKGKPVLLESFAVWCPTCTAQQKETKKLKQREGEAIIHISLDTDPNEDEAKIREHLQRNGFDWFYAVSPIELTNALIDEFGIRIVSAPSVPMILICEDQSTRYLKRGVKSSDDLLSEIAKGCE